MRHNEVTQLREWAISGAKVELDRIYSTFPELRQTTPQTTPVRTNGQSSQNSQNRTVSAAHRAKLSKMMTRRWRAARKAGLSKLG
jgi:hypothetical protein